MHKKMWMKKDKRGEIGIGTMIVFIAMVLVAAVAASVLISTANQVREQAQSTANQSLNNVASGFIAQDVVGTTNADRSQINSVTVYLRLAAGSPAINMDNVVITVVNGANSQFLTMGDAVNDSVYTAVPMVSISGFAWSASNHIAGQGDLLKLTIGDNSSAVGVSGVGFNSQCTIKIMPAYGQSTLIVFKTGENFPTTIISLK
jgi:flagellin FlaB